VASEQAGIAAVHLWGSACQGWATELLLSARRAFIHSQELALYYLKVRFTTGVDVPPNECVSKSKMHR
jgi:hypothetical protein